MSQTSLSLWRRFQADEPRAAEQLFRRYVARLTALANRRLSPKLAARLGAEDIVQSAYGSFFAAARSGRFAIEASGDLWRLLATMTVRKLRGQVEHHRAQLRSFEREESLDADKANEPAADRQPTASELIAAGEQAELLYAQLTPDQACAVQMRLENYTVPEIAAALSCTDRTVRRWLHTAKRLIEAQLSTDAAETTPPTESLELAGDLPTSLDHRDYLLQNHLGSGGMGRVYCALEKRTGQAFAFKTIRKSLATDPLALRRFRQEAAALAELHHPGIVALRGLGRLPSNAYFLLMDLVDGHSLADLPELNTVAPTRAAQIVADVADAIEFAHSRGIVHCDLKPANVLIDSRERVFVSDFGLACLVAAGDQPRLFGGTAAFMAPEQIDSAWGAIGPRTDVFGLGGLLYFLLTAGKRPHQGENRDATLLSARNRLPVEPISRWRPGVPNRLSIIAMRALAKDPRDRFASAAEMSAALRDWLTAEEFATESRSSDPATFSTG